MDTKKVATGIAVGWITMFVVGYLVFNMAMVGFYEANGAHEAAKEILASRPDADPQCHSN
jgi:hypothetical protein